MYYIGIARNFDGRIAVVGVCRIWPSEQVFFPLGAQLAAGHHAPGASVPVRRRPQQRNATTEMSPLVLYVEIVIERGRRYRAAM